MYQILFKIPFLGIPVYGYGVMMVVGFFAAMMMTQALARRSKIDPEIFANAALIALVAGVLGARLSHVLENLGDYTRGDLTFWENFRNAANIRSGGLTYYGGFLLAFPSLVLYGIHRKVPIRLGMDIIAPCLMIGLGFGRVGCFLNGCCYGAECKTALSIQFPYGSDAYMTEFAEGKLDHPVPPELLIPTERGSRPMTREELEKREAGLPPDQRQALEKLAAAEKSDWVHPAQLYSALTAFLLAAFLLAYFTLPHVPGHVFAAMMMMEAVFRYLLEMLRVEPAVVGRGTGHLGFLPPQSYSMVVSVFLLAGGIVLWLAFGRVGGTTREEQRQLRAAAA
jgi:phosphatidylglycerol:prolipoprotein diacylglycerol transferase